ncbi:MAG: NarK family nitrate/nitrite MFS transporter [Actinobacteria bacterium]|nr:NarK family nitrate/nitrite MFS transporter [Actinomycetota bacterium]
MFRRGPAQRTLHLTWFAFFLTFVAWFNFAPFAKTIGNQFGLSKAQIVTLGLCNLALTVPARVIIGGVLDRLGPRRTFSAILAFAAVPCFLFATAQSFEQLIASRLLMGVVGAGFVVGIRMVSEWFPPSEVGTAEGIYGGWGNFGAAAAALTLPTIATVAGGSEGWRWAVALTGVLCLGYAGIYLRAVTDTPEGHTYKAVKRAAALEVTSRGAVFGLIAMSVPLAGALVVIAWRILHVNVISATVFAGAVAASLALLALQVTSVVRVNRRALADGWDEAEQYPFRSVAVLSLAYMCTFGSELAAVSFLPEYFEDTWGLSAALAGAAGSTFAVMNLISRPAGGLFSDVFGSRRRWLALILGCLAGGFLVLSRMTGAWPLGLALAAVLVTSLFAQAGNGAVYAIVPLVRHRSGGQIAGMAGAYGNVGGIVFLTVLMLTSPQTTFLVMGTCAVLACIACRWLVEPASSHDAVVDEPVAGEAPVPVAASVTGPVVDLAPAGLEEAVVL